MGKYVLVGVFCGVDNVVVCFGDIVVVVDGIMMVMFEDVLSNIDG